MSPSRWKLPSVCVSDWGALSTGLLDILDILEFS